MTLLEKIQSAQTTRDLDLLQVEIIMDHEHFTENQKAFVEKYKELDDG